MNADEHLSWALFSKSQAEYKKSTAYDIVVFMIIFMKVDKGIEECECVQQDQNMTI